jgi:hypothetical protein
MDIITNLLQSTQGIDQILLVLNAILHVIFASGVARDVGNFNRQHIPTQFISGMAWVLATLLGGVLVLAIYWLMHHSSLARRHS